MDSVDWRPVLGFEGDYLISNDGRVWSNHSNKILRNKCSQGYQYVSLCSQGFRQERRIHRLVAEAFIPNPENKPTVNHVNEVKADNRVENLEWATTQEQNVHGTRTKRAMEHTDWVARTLKTDYSEVARKHDYHNINRKQMRPVLQFNKHGILLARFPGLAIAARSTLVNQGHLCEHLKGRRKSCGGFIWKYEKADDAAVAV
jgi:hypothetical protein